MMKRPWRFLRRRQRRPSTCCQGTGALLCGAAGLLKGVRATTHWSAFHLLEYFGAVPVNERVVVDGKLISTAGVTAGSTEPYISLHSCAVRVSPSKSNFPSNMSLIHLSTVVCRLRHQRRLSRQCATRSEESRTRGLRLRDGSRLD